MWNTYESMTMTHMKEIGILTEGHACEGKSLLILFSPEPVRVLCGTDSHIKYPWGTKYKMLYRSQCLEKQIKHSAVLLWIT